MSSTFRGASVLVLYLRLDDAVAAPQPRIGIPPSHAERVAAMSNATARRHTLAGLWLLERGLWLCGHDDVDVTHLAVAPGGRPYLPEGPDFSISHTDGLAACAIGRGCRVGLDVEWPRPIDVARMRRYLERSDAPADRERFFRAWTAREATVKASGGVGLARIARVVLEGEMARLDGERWRLQRPMLDRGYVACLATDHPAHVSIRRLEPPDG